MTWIQASTLTELLDLKAQYPEAKLVVGNTEIGESGVDSVPGGGPSLAVCPQNTGFPCAALISHFTYGGGLVSPQGVLRVPC